MSSECRHLKGDLVLHRWLQEGDGTNKSDMEVLFCTACAVKLVTSSRSAADGERETESPKVVSVGDEEWYRTEVAYKLPRDAERDGVVIKNIKLEV